MRNFFTTNEFDVFVDSGYGEGRFAPGLKLPPARLNQVRHNAVLGHGLAVQAIRAKAAPGTRIGLAENLAVGVPIVETPEHIEAAERFTRETNASYLTVILEGRYTDAYLKSQGANAPKYDAEDLKIISSPLDFVGINVYVPKYVRAIDAAPGYEQLAFPKSHPRMAAPWSFIGPEALYWGPRHLVKLWNVKDIYITENGCAAADEPDADGVAHDVDRIMFLRNSLSAASARDVGGRAGARLFPLESHGQFRVGERLWIAVRIGPRRLCDLEADAEAQRHVFQGGGGSEPGSVTRATEFGGR